MPYHEYGSLSTGGIRLIRILPSKTDPNEQIQITLESHNLENADFDALSYTWGASTLEECEQSDAQIFTTMERCYPVLCCNKIILCTKSLRTALCRLRTYHDDVKARVFQHVTRRPKLALTWADGLCINRDDPDERATQVALMGTLYTKANQVLAFVGEFNAGAKTALDMVIRLNDISLSARGSTVSRMDFYDEELHAASGKPPMPSEWWEWVIFLSRNWFQRTWVLQEVANSFHRTTVICGQFRILLMVVINSIAAVVAFDWNLDIAGELRSEMVQSPRYELYADKALQWLLQSSQAFYLLSCACLKGETPSFYELSQAILPQTRCSDPRDKVYATLGIASEWQQRISMLLPIDYKHGTFEVFTRATKHAISLSKSLDLLSSRAERSTRQKYCLPTWCPDYDEPKRYPQSLRYAIWSRIVVTRWCATMGSSVTRLVSLQPLHHLTLRGRYCGTIKSSGSLGSFFNECSTIHLPLRVLHDLVRRDDPGHE